MRTGQDVRTATLAWATVVRPAWRRTKARLISIPFTLAVLGVFLLTGAVTGSYLAGPPESMLDIASVSGPGLKSGMWWSLFTSMFLPPTRWPT